MIHARRYIFSRGPFFPCYMRNPRQHCVLIAIRLISRNSFLFNQPVPLPSKDFRLVLARVSSAAPRTGDERKKKGWKERKNGERSGKKKKKKARRWKNSQNWGCRIFHLPLAIPYAPLQLFNLFRWSWRNWLEEIHRPFNAVSRSRPW